jgi:eukaryotic-like serine/threonine-protein kinase
MICPRCHRRYASEAPNPCPSDGEPLVSIPEIELVPTRPTDEIGVAYAKRYVVRGLIGKGAFAKVYLAEDTRTKRAVAIKVLESPDARVPDAKERFFREVKATDGVSHPNIVRMLDAGQRPDGAPYLIMEYLFGETLGERLQREQRLDIVSALWVARAVASALSAAHAAGVIHRDVKPHNVFLVGELGNPFTLKLVDFGFARLQGHSAFTALGITVGTLEYMAPEQAVRDNTGPCTDIYALGVLLYRIITGELPFTGSDSEVLAQHLILPPTAPSAKLPDLDARLEAMILTSMRKLPRNRYPSMEDFLEDIDCVLEGRSAELAAGTIWETDVYRPQTAYARTVAATLYKKLGIDLPNWQA